MTMNHLKPVTPDELAAARSVFERLAAGAPIAMQIDAPTWRDDLEAGSPDVVEISVAARRLKVSVDTIKRRCTADPSLGGRVGNRWRVSLSRILADVRRRA